MAGFWTCNFFATYAFLLFLENRRTHQCHPSYRSIAEQVGISKNTVMKSVCALVDAGLISIAPTTYYDSKGMKWTGNNLYTILPIRKATEQSTNSSSANSPVVISPSQASPLEARESAG